MRAATVCVCLALALPARAETEATIEITGGDCIDREQLRRALADHGVALAAGDHLRIDSSGESIAVELSSGGRSIRHEIEPTDCAVLPDVLAAFVATAAAGPVVEVDAPSRPRYVQVLNAARREIARRSPRFSELGASLDGRLDRAHGLVVLVSGPSPRCAARRVVGDDFDVLSAVEGALDAFDDVEHCESTARGNRTVSERAQVLYEWQHRHFELSFFKADPRAITAGISGVIAGGAALLGEGEVDTKTRIGFGVAGGLWLTGGVVAVAGRDGSYSKPVAKIATYAGWAALSFAIANHADDYRPFGIAGVAYLSAAAITTGDVVIRGSVGRGQLRRDYRRIDTDAERQRLTDAELSAMEARYARVSSPTSTLIEVTPLIAGMVVSVGAGLAVDDEASSSFMLSGLSLGIVAGTSLMLDRLDVWSFRRGERPLSPKLVPTGNGVAAVGRF